MADLIEKDAVIKQIAEVQDKVSSGIEDLTFYRAIKVVRDAPAVNRWIPCGERLPENFNYVIAAGSDGIGIVRYNGALFADDSGAIYPISAFTHWMPLPSPPESEVQDE